MSFSRENYIWQSPDGTWSMGFLEIVHQGDGDPEWDVEYGSKFSHVTTGHPTADAARDAWKGANPGGGWEVPYDEKNADEIAEFDADVAEIKKNGNKDRVYAGWWYR